MSNVPSWSRVTVFDGLIPTHPPPKKVRQMGTKHHTEGITTLRYTRATHVHGIAAVFIVPDYGKAAPSNTGEEI